MFYRQTFEPLAGEQRVGVLGNDQSDGKPGLVISSFGKGKTILMGSLAGLAYLAPAATESSQVLLMAYSEPIRQFWPSRPATRTRPNRWWRRTRWSRRSGCRGRKAPGAWW